MAQFNVNLAFNADTGKAKTQIMELQSLLSKIAYTGTTGGTDKLQTDLHAASEAAKELQFHLNNAFNASTGNFDLSMLDRSLKTSGSNVTDLSMKLLSAGATGQQAFVKLAQSISLADQPMFRISNRMKEFAVTMKNTIKWQLSSSMLHGFMGAVQSAYGYAQDLNKSLNDIRIVTGYNTDKMAQFAEQANKAAKALSTTTTDYTNASLIYFQQGLSDSEVAARTDITVKMANAVGQSTEVISEQLTAVWNNFADGSKSLEYYADVMTALGAATASSSDEISEGLSKFAAVAGSVGLSYEYATSALATLTSNTRESADVVGNALKTLFARIQGLQLGETLEDGTNLNKYSQALEKVGISIYDANGGLKDMDNILDEMAAKWNTLNDTQQVALAQTVAGVRQYNQLIALMENWNNGDNDSMIANLQTTKNSEGSLQKQADIYAESWEAAEKRVKAAAEGIFQSLLKDDFFIGLTDGFATVLKGIDAFIDGAGGVKTVLTGIASIVISTFAHKIPQALDTLRYNLEFATKGSQAAYDRIQSDMTKATQAAFDKYQITTGQQGIKEDSSMGYAIKQANELTAARNKLSLVSEKMSASEMQMANTELSLIEATQQEVISLKQKNEELQKSIDLQKQNIMKANIGEKVSNNATMGLLDDSISNLQGQQEYYDKASQRKGKKQSSYVDTAESYKTALAEIQQFAEAFDIHKNNIAQKYDELNKIMFESFTAGKTADVINSQQLFGDLDFNQPKGQIDSMIQSIERLMATANETNSADIFTAVKDEIAALSSTIPQAVQEATGLDKIFKKIASNSSTQNLDQLGKRVEQLKNGFKTAKIESKNFEKILKSFHGKSIDNLAGDMNKLAESERKAAAQARDLEKLLNNFNPKHVIRMSEAFGSLAGILGNVSMLMNSLKSIGNALSPDVDMTMWERISTIFMGLSMSVPAAMSMLKGFGSIVSWLTTVNTANTASIHAQTIAQNTNTLAKKLATTSSGMLTQRLTAEQIAKVANIVATEKEAGSSGKATAAKVVEYLTSNNIVKGKAAELIARLAVKLGTDLETASVWSLIGALLVEQATILGITAPVWVLVAAFAALAAIIAVVAVAAYNAYNADALAAEQANKQVELLTENYNKLKEAADSFKEAVSNYDEAIKALDGLDTKTKEYADALEKANEEARNLIETYGLYDDFTYENGLITIDEDALTAAQAERDQIARQAQNELYASRIGANNMNLNSQATNLVRKENLPLSRDELLGLAEVINEISESNGGVQLSAEKLNAALSNNTNLLIEHGLTLNDLSNVITEDTIDSLYSFSESLDKATDANIYYAGQILDNRRDDYYGGTTTEAATDSQGNVDYNQEALMDAAIDTIVESKAEGEGNGLRSSEQEAAAQEALYNDFVKNTTGYDAANDYENLAESTVSKYLHGASLESVYGQMFKGASYDGNINTQEMLYDYLRAQGYTNISVDDKANGTNDVTYTDASGKVVTANYTNDAAQQMWGQHISDYILDTTYKEQLDNTFSTEDAEALLNNIMSAESQYGVSGEQWGNLLLSSIANNNGETLDFSSIFSQLDPSEIEQLRNLTDEEKLNLFGLSSADWEALGLTSAAQFGEAFDSALEDYSVKSYTDAINSKYENLAESYDIDLDEYKAYRDLLAETNESLKDQPELLNKIALRQKRLQKGVKSLSDNWEDFNKAMSSGDIAKISEVLPEVNDALKDMLDLTDEEFEGLSPDFAVKNWELIQDYMNGVEGSYEKIQTAAAAEIIFGASYDLDGLQDSEQALIDEMLAFQAEHGDLEIGATIDTSEALSGLWSLYDSGKMTVGQLQDAFNSLGWEPEIEYVPIDAETAAAMRSAGYQEYAVMNSDGSMSIHSVPLDGELVQSSDQQYYIPKIKSKNATNTGGSRPPSPPGHTDKGGGGGGGSKKHAEKKDSGDRTRYHTIQNQLEDLSAAYDEVSEAADRAFGLEKLDLIDEQISATDDLIAKQKEYVDALAKDVPVDKAVMDAYYDNLIGGPAMEFDENGNIANYDEIEAAMHAKYNEMADKYTDDSEEWQVFEKQYEQMEKYIEDYEKYYDDLRDAEAEYQNLINQRIDLQLQKVQYKVELELDIENDEMELLEYQLSLIEDDAFKSAEAITLLTKQAESLYDQIQVNKQGLNDTLGLSLSAAEITSIMAGDLSVLDGKTFTEDQISAIRDYRDNLLALNEQFNEVRQSIEEQVMATFDAWQEKLERGSAALEHYGSILESYQNIVDIVGTDTLGLSSQFMADLSQAKVDNSIDQLEAAKSSYEAVSAAQKEAQEALAAAQAAGDEESISMWEETLITLNEEAQAASEELMAAWEEALSGIVEAFDMAVDRAVQDFNDAIYSLGGVEGLLDAFQNAQETSDLMLEDYQQIYELSKLSRDINNSIDDTENLAGKQKLKKLLGEINKLQEEGVEMSQYDLEYLQAEYQLRLAEIELEEAQNAKNTVRLQKDNEGNWSYVYTQNTDAVDEAQQKYEDALYSMQDLSSNYIDEMSEQLINTSQEMAEALAALRVEDFASIDEYYAEVERVQAEYEEKMALQENELQKAIDNNKELYDTDWTNYHNATGYKISDTENFVTNFKDSLLGTLLDSESDTANFTDILGQATASLTTSLLDAAATYYQNLDSAMEAAGTTTESFAEDTKANIEAIVEASTTGAEAIDQMATEMTEAFSAITDSVTSWQETYGVAMQEIIDSNIAVIESFNDMIAALAIDEGSVTVKYDISSAPETDAAQFDTGGYTGTWGNAGKVAVLHEKELILDEDDTSNFLSAIQVTRAMLETIDLNAKQASMGVGNLVPSTVKDEVVQTLEQEVHITAEFPNVSDHNEVEEALKNLMNTASQYANRKS